MHWWQQYEEQRWWKRCNTCCTNILCWKCLARQCGFRWIGGLKRHLERDLQWTVSNFHFNAYLLLFLFWAVQESRFYWDGWIEPQRFNFLLVVLLHDPNLFVDLRHSRPKAVKSLTPIYLFIHAVWTRAFKCLHLPRWAGLGKHGGPAEKLTTRPKVGPCCC